jgi:ribosomal-protein-alanine N-acetyltransferase
MRDAADDAEATIAAMVAADLDEVLEIERHAFHSPWSRQLLVEELERDWARLEVVRSSDGHGAGRIVAYINYWLVRDEVHLLNLAVHPDARRRGHGDRLMAHLVEFARAQACRYVTLEVRRSNLAAITLYRNHGFESVGVRPRYYSDDQEDAVVMLLELADGDGDGDGQPAR